MVNTKVMSGARMWLLPVDLRAELRPAALDDGPGLEIVRADGFVHGRDGREVRQVENLDERLQPPAPEPERARDARIERLHVAVVLGGRIDDGERQAAAARQTTGRQAGDAGARAGEHVIRADTDAGPRLERDAHV